MKKVLLYLFILISTSSAYYGCSQKAVYSTAADTVNLNKEYREVARDLAKQRNELEETRSKIPIYESKAKKAESESKEVLEASSRQAQRATSGSVKQARRAEKKADKARDAAEEARDLRKKVDNLNDKLEELITEVNKKEQRLAELDEQRMKIRNLPNPKRLPSEAGSTTIPDTSQIAQ